MSTANYRDVAKERFWRRIVRQWRESGLSVRAFCAQQGLAEPNSYAWRRTIRERDSQSLRHRWRALLFTSYNNSGAVPPRSPTRSRMCSTASAS
jgi:hypothetical protein